MGWATNSHIALSSIWREISVQRGKFITFEGGEGSGKSTQISLLSSYLTQQNIDHIITREPGGTPLAERIRPLLVEPNDEEWDAMAETLLFIAARVQHVTQKIEPALASGKWVLCDRFSDSTFVYQGVGKKIGIEKVKRIQELALGKIIPDLTFLLYISPEEGLKRAASRNDKETRFEDYDISFHHALRTGFQQIAAQSHVITLDGSQAKNDIHAQIRAALT